LAKTYEKGIAISIHVQLVHGPFGRFCSDEPEAKMLQNGIDDLPILNGADDPHGSSTFRANERSDLIDFLNQTGPAFPACL
jgi:hypothetical protein